MRLNDDGKTVMMDVLAPASAIIGGSQREAA